VVSSTPRPHFTPGKDPVPILQNAGWAPGPVRRGGKSRPHRDSIPDRPARSQSLCRLSYPAHTQNMQYLFFPPLQQCCTNAPLYYVIPILSVVFFVFFKLDRGLHCKCGRGCIFFICALHYYCPLIVQLDTRTINVLHIRRKYYHVLCL